MRPDANFRAKAIATGLLLTYSGIVIGVVSYLIGDILSKIQ